MLAADGAGYGADVHTNGIGHLLHLQWRHTFGTIGQVITLAGDEFLGDAQERVAALIDGIQEPPGTFDLLEQEGMQALISFRLFQGLVGTPAEADLGHAVPYQMDLETTLAILEDQDIRMDQAVVVRLEFP